MLVGDESIDRRSVCNLELSRLLIETLEGRLGGTVLAPDLRAGGHLALRSSAVGYGSEPVRAIAPRRGR
jgi:hypothetical protein